MILKDSQGRTIQAYFRYRPGQPFEINGHPVLGMVFCELVEVAPRTEQSKPVFLPIGASVGAHSYCSARDQFVRWKGRKIAFAKAVRLMFAGGREQAEARRAIWNSFLMQARVGPGKLKALRAAK